MVKIILTENKFEMARAATASLNRKRTPRIVKYLLHKEIVKKNILFTLTGSFLGISLIGFVSGFFFDINDTFFLIGSFGASAVLLYGLPNSPLSKSRNLFGGHLLSGAIGVAIAMLLGNYPPIAAGAAVAISIAVMQITKTIHPPGGATALIAVIGSAKIKALGFFYLLSPVLAGVIILFLVARLVKPLKRF